MRTAALALTLALGLTSLAAVTGAFAAPLAPAHAHPAKATLTAFADDAEFRALIERWRDAAKQRAERRRLDAGAVLSMQAAPTAPMAAESSAKAANATPAGAGSDAITNVQTAGVDEGGIVKRAGDHLVILRRGRLFTIRVGGESRPADDLRPIAAVDAYAPGASPQGAWYDELLIHGRTVVVVGYSYSRGGTEIGLFELGDDGSLAYRATHHLRSSDYYSSRNYASRLVGNRLVFYAPMPVNPWQLDPRQFMPHWRRWHPAHAHAQSPQDWKPILPATRIFRTDDELDPFGGATLHTVTACELGSPTADRRAGVGDTTCEAQAVLAPPGRVFYVSADNVFVWTTANTRRGPWSRPDDGAMPRSSVVRMPLDGSAPSALKTTGAPIDPLSFLQDAGGHLNVLLRSHARGDGMWGAEASRGDFALMRVPLASFGNGRDAAPRSAYRPLPGVSGHAVHNRFVGDWLLYGAAGQPRVQALRYADGAASGAMSLDLNHGVERIEALGGHALVAGNRGRDLHFTTLRLERTAGVASTVVQADAAQGETRTHGFFYRATSAAPGRSEVADAPPRGAASASERGGPMSHDDGLLGLPIVGTGVRAYPHAKPGPQGTSASVTFLRNHHLELKPIGTLDANATGGIWGANSDGCKASCVDWYGNARPIFLGDRVFALMGYELVEGVVDGGVFRDETIRERRRIDFSPQPAMRWGREG